MKITAIALNTFREALRNKVLYSAVLFAVVLVGVSAFFGAVSIGDQVKVIKSFGLFALSFFGAVITILAGVSLLHKEIAQKTVYNILAKPVARWQFVAGKYIGLALTVNVLISLMGLGLVGFAACFEKRIDWLLFQGIFFTLLEMSVIAAVAMFFSSIAVTITLTGIFTLAAYVAGRSIDYLSHFTQQDYNPALALVVEAFDRVLPHLNYFNVGDQVVYGQAVPAYYAILACGYCAAYCTVAVTLAALIFSKRELR